MKIADKLELTASRLHARSAATMYLKHTGRWNVASTGAKQARYTSNCLLSVGATRNMYVHA